MGRSPFGFYDTYITSQEWLSYLESYPGYHLPDKVVLDKIVGAMDTMVAKASSRPDLKAKVDKLADEVAADLAAKGQAAQMNRPRRKVDRVTWNTILEATGMRGGSDIPSQATQMGGSASDVSYRKKKKDLSSDNVNNTLKQIAKVAGWDKLNPAGRVAGHTDQGRGIVWDAPGVYPAEVSLTPVYQSPIFDHFIMGKKLTQSPHSGSIEAPSPGGTRGVTTPVRKYPTLSSAPARPIAS